MNSEPAASGVSGAPSVSTARLRLAAVVGAAALVGLLAFRLVSLTHHAAATPQSNAPLVSVARARVSAAPTVVSINGTISARYDVPIGVEGEGGRVAEVLVEAGDRVARGQLLVKLDGSILAAQVGSLEAALEQARAEAALASAEYNRATAVGPAGALSAEETERRKAAAVTAAARVKAAEATLAEARARLSRTSIRAPADGTILTRNVEIGQTVTPGGPSLFRLAEGDEVELRGQVAEQDLPRLRVGQPASVRLTGIERAFEGKVRLLGAVIDPQTRLGSVRVSLQPDPNLRPGAFARAEVTISTAPRVLVPQTAVLSDDRGTYVLLVDDSRHIVRRPVRVDSTTPTGVLIGAGLSGEDRIVTVAGGFLQEGESVQIVEAADAMR